MTVVKDTLVTSLQLSPHIHQALDMDHGQRIEKRLVREVFCVLSGQLWSVVADILLPSSTSTSTTTSTKVEISINFFLSGLVVKL